MIRRCYCACELNLTSTEQKIDETKRKNEKGKYSIKQSYTKKEKKIGRAKLEKFFFYRFCGCFFRLWSDYIVCSRDARCPYARTFAELCNFVYSALRRFNVMIHEQFANRFFHILPIPKIARYIVPYTIFPRTHYNVH